ncbi:hypothetical protein K2X33_08310 [bacterium]|nr:hypothetical protein [bacterium]
MSKTPCTVCQLPRAELTCGLCLQQVCKKCSEKLKPARTEFLTPTPPELAHSLYCGRCFDAKVAPELARYDSWMEKARQVHVYSKHQSEETRLMDRLEKPLRIEGGNDRAETLLRLAFLAVQRGFTTLIDVDIRSEKVRNGGYQTTSWTGTGIPTDG